MVAALRFVFSSTAARQCMRLPPVRTLRQQLLSESVLQQQQERLFLRCLPPQLQRQHQQMHSQKQQQQQQDHCAKQQHNNLFVQQQLWKPRCRRLGGIISSGCGPLLLLLLLLPPAELPFAFFPCSSSRLSVPPCDCVSFAVGCRTLHAPATPSSAVAGSAAAAVTAGAFHCLRQLLPAAVAFAAAPPPAAAGTGVSKPATAVVTAAATAAAAACPAVFAVSPAAQLPLRHQPVSTLQSHSPTSSIDTSSSGCCTSGTSKDSSNTSSSNSEVTMMASTVPEGTASKAATPEPSFETADDIVVGLVTAKDQAEGEKVAEMLVKQKLVACVNILPAVRSVYMWKGDMQKDSEVLLVMKTRKQLQGRVTAAVVQAHSYDVPEVIFTPLLGGYGPYLNFVRENTSD